MALEPLRGMIDHCVHCTRLREQMRGAFNDFQCFRNSQSAEGLLIQLDDLKISTPDNQQRRCSDHWERVASEIRASSAGNHRADALRKPGGSHESRCGPGAGTEQTDGKVRDQWPLPVYPLHHLDKAFRKQGNIEHVGPIGLFLRR